MGRKTGQSVTNANRPTYHPLQETDPSLHGHEVKQKPYQKSPPGSGPVGFSGRSLRPTQVTWHKYCIIRKDSLQNKTVDHGIIPWEAMTVGSYPEACGRPWPPLACTPKSHYPHTQGRE